MKVLRAKDFVQSKLERGYYTFSLKEAEDVIGTGEKTWEAINRLAKQGWLFSPSKGFYVIIDPQHQSSGFLPVEWFIDDWMKHLGGEYYLGMLTAAMLHGASHHKPQQTQVVRDKTFQDVDKGPYHISFFYKKAIPENCCEQRQSPAGYYRISTPEITAYDILRYPRACPSLDLAATVLQELGEKINPDNLAALADSGAETAVLQRLGWMLDNTGWAEKADSLADRLKGKHMVWRAIRTDMPKDGPRDPRWRVIANVEIEADL
ncbi:MAG: type IV toxin-antitoxin system AbiEi family antitoxin [Candidatus Marsarchaeota archaeon]|nr:type IV toxin-antitoxin system AbiEi family antitoxin [Candidatus Marsarchaeota archaeon]